MIEKKFVGHWIYSDITGCKTLGEIKELVSSLIEQYSVDTEICFDSGYNTIDESIRVDRLETDEEYQKRLKNEAREQDLIVKKEDKERKEWGRLNKKYGKTK